MRNRCEVGSDFEKKTKYRKSSHLFFVYLDERLKMPKDGLGTVDGIG